MTLTQELLAQVVDEVLETFVGSLSDEPQPADAVLPVTAFVQITGAWTGTVLVSCSTELAATVTGAMLALPPEEVAQEDVSDAVGEVANMVGGSVKSLIAEPAELSLPTVIFGAQGTSVPGTELLQQVERSCAGEPLRVTVLAADASHAGTGQVERALAGR
ncbi:MAG TPA: chemotaxis protein CheX [Marmoricola sp.]|nr:chemotaxis protein CheX [Marmoricola sp.]